MAKLRWKPEEAIAIGQSLYTLALADQTVLSPRLPAGAIEHLGADVGELRGDDRAAMTAKAQVAGTVADKAKVTGSGFDLAHSIREALRTTFPDDKALQKAFGVGKRLGKTEVKTVIAALQAIKDGNTLHSAELREAGVLPEDLQRVDTAVAALDTAVDAKEGKQLTAKQAAALKVKVQGRIEAMVIRIVGKADLAFHSNAERKAAYQAALPAAPAKPAKKSASAPAPAK